MANISQNWLEKIGVLIPFTKGYYAKLHASEISRILHLPQRTVARRLEHLQKTRLLSYKREGRNKYYYLDLNLGTTFSLLNTLETVKEVDFTLEHPQLSLLLHELSESNSVIIFGSYALGKAKEDSDVDIVILGKKSKKISFLIKKYPFDIQAHYVTPQFFEKRLTKEWPLAKEIAKNHVLFGKKEEVIKILMKYTKSN